MAIIRLMLPLFCQLISISPRAMGDNRLLHHPRCSTETRCTQPRCSQAGRGLARGMPRARPAARDEVRHRAHGRLAPPGRRACKKGHAPRQSSPMVPATPWAHVPTQRKKISQHPGVIAAPWCYLSRDLLVPTPSPRTALRGAQPQPAPAKVMVNTHCSARLQTQPGIPPPTQPHGRLQPTCLGTGCPAETGGTEQAIAAPHFERG